jgi:catechol 2,3-dioxygenase-like lactoylglutathione lyase family enzyme
MPAGGGISKVGLTLCRAAAYTAIFGAFCRVHPVRRWQMARIKHIALVTDDPAKTAEFYKQHFGLTELYRRPTDSGEKGVWLSDGYIYFAILKYGTGDAPKLGPEQSSDLRGIHHIGFQVDDVVATEQQLKVAGVRPVPMEGRGPREATLGGPPSDSVNLKYLGPDAVQFDVRQRGWDESIGLAMQRFELTPAADEAAE